MHFSKAALSLVLLAGSAMAQLSQIVLPAYGSTLTAGTNITVQIGMSDLPVPLDEVSVVIGLDSCGTNGCPTANESMGQVLYQGPINPISPGPAYLYENFTVTVPADFPAGTATVNVVHLYLFALANIPTIEFLNQTVTVVG